MDLVETRQRMLGARDDAEYVEVFRRLSLLDQGLLDRPCAPLLLVNGKEDKQCPVPTSILLLERGSPRPFGCSLAGTWDSRRKRCRRSSSGFPDRRREGVR